MFKHILIATDGSDLAAKAVSTGPELASALAAQVTFVVVSEPHTHLVPVALPPVLNEDAETVRKAAEAILANARAEAAKLKVSCTCLHVSNEFPAEAIVKETTVRHCNLIVMASHGRRGLARLVLGGETLRVITHSPIPVLVCR